MTDNNGCRVRRYDNRRLNNPFPGRPKGLGFIHGSLCTDPHTLPAQSFPIGEGFLLKWTPENGGVLTVSHRAEPLRSIWSTVPGAGFISAALADHWIEESRGSVAVHDNKVMICSHQTLEDIAVVYPSKFATEHPENEGFSIPKETLAGNAENPTVNEGFAIPKETLGGNAEGPTVTLTGCLYSTSKVAQEQIKQFAKAKNHSKGPFYRSNSGEEYHHPGHFKSGSFAVRYYLSFIERSDHHLGFTVSLDEPALLQTVDRECFHGIQTRLDQVKLIRHGLGSRHHKHYRGSLIDKTSQNGSVLRERPRSLIHRTKQQVQLFRSSDSQELLGTENLVQRLSPFNRVAITISSQKDERFYGFGEQFSYLDMKGKRVPILVQEQGLGRGDQPITAAANLIAYRSGGDWSTTYAPSPFYITSTMKSLYLEGYDFSVFDLTMHDRVQIQIYGASAQGRILHGTSPIELIERYTEVIGRMPELPNWLISGAVVGMQGGTESVHQIWDQLKKYDVPISAFWLQDWVGQRRTSIGCQLWWNWEVDTDTYSNWRQLVEVLRSSDIRTMAYCNPCIAPTDAKANRKRNLFKEASKQGLFVKNGSGSTYMIPNTTFDVGMLDLTNPAARSWFKGILHEMADTGIRGWMADFGEGLPLDACLFSGADPISAHNRYPELWAQINREFIEEWKAKQLKESANNPKDKGGLGDDDEQLVFFMRAGFRESPKWATLFWEGDQMVSWQRNDGIKSAVVGLLSGGLSGYSLNHSDIGGYCAVNLPLLWYRRSEELLLRWMELNSFSTVFRTHEGNLPSANKQFYSNDRILSHFARFAKVYKAWEFYRIQLVKEASRKGLPVVRHLFLHYPHDRQVQKLTYQQFLLGSEILVVPVLDKGKKDVKAYFPAGQDWQHIWTGRIFSPPKSFGIKGMEAWIRAPIGYPAVFVKVGSDIGRTFQKNLVDLGVASPYVPPAVNGTLL